MKNTNKRWALGPGYSDVEMEDRINGEYSGPKYADLGIYCDGKLVLPLGIDHYQIRLDMNNGEDVAALERVLGELVEKANKFEEANQ